MLIRKANIDDFKSLCIIRDPLILTPDRLSEFKTKEDFARQGYLLDEYPENVFQNDLRKIFLVSEIDSNICGYIRIDDEVENDFIQMINSGEIIWLDDGFKKKYCKLPHYEVGAILVDLKSHQKGIGKMLLDSAISEILSAIPENQNEEILFSFVMIEPITNEASIKFHNKNDFIKVAEMKPCKLFGFEGYKSFLFARTIKKSV